MTLNVVEQDTIRTGPSIDAKRFADIRYRTIFECHKWDAQIGDQDVLCRFPLILSKSMWNQLAFWAEALAREVLEAEYEILKNPSLWDQLGISTPIQRLLAWIRPQVLQPSVRLMRFDFHPTIDGWKISEGNTDVPGGWIESSGFTELVAEHFPAFTTAGHPAKCLAEALARNLPAGSSVAMVHATSYTDDRQVMMYLADFLAPYGMKTHFISPDHLSQDKERLQLSSRWAKGALDAIVRFYPADWLYALESVPRGLFQSSATLLCNPATAILTQSKRFPLIWDRLKTSLSTWHALLPKTCATGDVPWRRDEWVLKPAWGREGSNIRMANVSSREEDDYIFRCIQQSSRAWVAQKRFPARPIESEDGMVYPCLGVYTVDGKAAGIYGRIARKPLIDGDSRDIAVLIDSEVAFEH